MPVFSAPPIRKDDPPTTRKEDPPIIVKEDLPVIRKADPPVIASSPQNDLIAQVEETGSASSNSLQESKTVQSLEQLKI